MRAKSGATQILEFQGYSYVVNRSKAFRLHTHFEIRRTHCPLSIHKGSRGEYDLDHDMITISKTEFERICYGIAADKDSIIRHNPIGTDNEVLLWMLLSCLNSYLSLTEQESPCFTGVPDESTYRDAILFVLKNRAEGGFDPGPIIDNLVK